MQGGTAKRAYPDGESPVAFDFPTDTPQGCGAAGGPVRRRLHCRWRHLSRDGSGVEPRATREPRRATVPNGLGPVAVPCLAWAQLSPSHRWPQNIPEGVCGGTGSVRASLSSSARQVPCSQHLHLSPAHHPARMLAKLKRGMYVCRPPPAPASAPAVTAPPQEAREPRGARG